MAATQTNIDALTARVTALDAKTTATDALLKTYIANTNTQIAALQAANPGVDVTALTTSLTQLETDFGALSSNTSIASVFSRSPEPNMYFRFTESGDGVAHCFPNSRDFGALSGDVPAAPAPSPVPTA